MSQDQKYTQQKFEKRAKEIHGNLYDYSHDIYKGMNIHYNIMCPSHGIFRQKPACHIHQEQGCKQCYLDGTIQRNREKHNKKIKDKHGDYYKVINWLDATTLQGKILSDCQDHGSYQTTLYSLLNTSYGGCQGCKRLNESDTFISKAKNIHGNKYDYNREDYSCSRTLMNIYCKTHEKVFKQRPSAHLQGQGCPDCGKANAIINSTKSLEDFINDCKKIHGNKYDYSKTIYTKANSSIIVICHKHGEFTTNSSGHMAGSGCMKCYKEKTIKRYSDKFHETVNCNPNYTHLDFSKAIYINNRTKVEVFCKDHNETFFTTPNKLLDTDENRCVGCKTCARIRMNRWTIRAVKKIPNIDTKEGLFYTGKISGLRGIKIGITSDEYSRMTHYIKDLSKIDEYFNYQSVLKTNYLKACVIESVLKKVLRKHKVLHDLDFGGKNEVYDIQDYSIIEDIMSGRFSLEFEYLAKECTHDNDPILLRFADKLKNVYSIE